MHAGTWSTTTTRWTDALNTTPPGAADHRLAGPAHRRQARIDQLRRDRYRVGNRYVGTTVEVRLVSDTVQIALDGALLRTHRARHDKTKEFGALAQPKGKPRRVRL